MLWIILSGINAFIFYLVYKKYKSFEGTVLFYVITTGIIFILSISLAKRYPNIDVYVHIPLQSNIVISKIDFECKEKNGIYRRLYRNYNIIPIDVYGENKLCVPKYIFSEDK